MAFGYDFYGILMGCNLQLTLVLICEGVSSPSKEMSKPADVVEMTPVHVRTV